MSEKLFENNQSGQFVSVDGTNIHYYEEGFGEPLLLIHGIGQTMHTFRKNIQALAAHSRVIAIDLIGHGTSGNPDCKYLIADYSNSIIAFLREMQIEKTSIMAFSTGAIIALDIAINNPQLVNKLFLLSPGGLTEKYPRPIKWLTVPIIRDIIFTFFNKCTVKSALSKAYFDKTLATGALVANYFTNLSNRDNLDAVIETFSNWDDAEIAYSLHTISVPMYIFWGENDTWHPLDCLELYEEAIQNLYAATVRNCGHMVHEEKPNEINKKISQILAGE